MKLVNDDGDRVDTHGKYLSKKKEEKRGGISTWKKIGILIVVLILFRTLLLFTKAQDESGIMIQIIETPIHFAVDPVGHSEENPLGVLIWLGFSIWFFHKTIKKRKQAEPPPDSFEEEATSSQDDEEKEKYDETS